MSMFDLNGEDFQEREIKPIFNQGQAGKVNNVRISSIEKKAMDGAPGAPDYKVIFEDDYATVNVGFWRNPNNPKIEVQRAKHIANAIVEPGFIYPTPKEDTAAAALDVIMKVIRDNASDKEFNVFVTYGNSFKASKYLGLRYFDFIEKADTPEFASRLVPKTDDVLERIMEDAPQDENDNSTSNPASSELDNDDDTWV